MSHNLTVEVERVEKFSKENLRYCTESDMGRIAEGKSSNEITFFKVATKSKLTQC